MGFAHTPADNLFYDLVSIQYHALKGTQVYEQYLADAEGHDDVRQFIDEVQRQDAERATRCHEPLGRLTKEYGSGMGADPRRCHRSWAAHHEHTYAAG